MNNRQALAAGIILATLTLVACVAAWTQQTPADSSINDLPPRSEPPTSRQIQALVSRAVENQHRDDLALSQYERREKIIIQRGKEIVASERSMEFIPVGGHFIRIELERDGKGADADSLEQQCQQAAREVASQAEPRGPNAKEDNESEMRRARERYEMVDAVARAFRFNWVGRHNEGGRELLEFSFEPDTHYRSSKLFAIVYAHITGTVWVDEASSQVVSIDATLKDDISIGAGLIVKVYRGAQATLRQQEVASGVWEPTHYSFDFEGRKLLFGTLSGHERMDAGDYRPVGSPQEAIATFRREHLNAAVSSR